MAIVISGFPGVGKSCFFKSNPSTTSDSDSSLFPKDEFPSNYIEHIISLLNKRDVILVSSHKIVREALEDADIEYFLVYPDRSLKEEYIERYKARGNTENFIKLVESEWDNWISELEKEEYPVLITLQSGQFLKDAMASIV